MVLRGLPCTFLHALLPPSPLQRLCFLFPSATSLSEHPLAARALPSLFMALDASARKETIAFLQCPHARMLGVTRFLCPRYTQPRPFTLLSLLVTSLLEHLL